MCYNVYYSYISNEDRTVDCIYLYFDVFSEEVVIAAYLKKNNEFKKKPLPLQDMRRNL